MHKIWKTAPLHTVLNKVIDYRGKAPPKSEQGIRLITARNVRKGALDFSHEEFIEKGLYEAWMNRGRPSYGDILFTTEAPLGNVSMFPKYGTYAVGQRIVTLRTNPSKMQSEFLCQYLLSDEGQDRIAFRATGSTATGIKSKELLKILVPIPTLVEQRTIAEILRTWDEAIEKLEALRKTNLQRRIWMRSHLFTGRTRLPGFTGEWREVTLAEVLTEHGLQGTGAEEVFSVSVHKGLINQIEHLGRSFAAAETGHYNRVLPGDIVYTKSPTGDFPLGIIKQSKISAEVIVSPLYGVFTPFTHALGVILDALFESPITVRNYLHPLVQKGAKNTIAITNRRFLEGKLRLPMDAAEQSAIAEVVDVSRAELTAIEAEIDLLTRQKRGLMQKLLTGEWRVNPHG